MRFWQNLSRLYPFTTAGTLLFICGLYLLGKSWYSENIYAFLFSVLSLFSLFFLLILGRLQTFRFAEMQIMWDSSRPLFARVPDMYQVFYVEKHKPFYFFRFHLVMSGRLQAGREAYLYFYAQSAVSSGGAVRVAVNLPVSGNLEAKAQLILRDVFGFVRFPFGLQESRTLTIRPPMIPLNAPRRFLSMFSEESVKRRKSSEEEKYYMREYIPGDRLKDINWKASVRVSEIITRISPLSPESSYSLTIEFRPYRADKRDTATSILLLNYAKSWLISFIKAVKEYHAAFQFQIYTGSDTHLLKNEEDVERFTVRLSALNFMNESSRARNATEIRNRDIFIFTTNYDTGLAAYLNARQSDRAFVFRTSPVTSGQSKTVRFFENLSPDILPGYWIMRSNGADSNPKLPVIRGSLIEERLKVRLF